MMLEIARIRALAGRALTCNEILDKAAPLAELASASAGLSSAVVSSAVVSSAVVSSAVISNAGAKDRAAVIDAAKVGRPLGVRLVPPRELKRRTWGSVAGRGATIHALAHIEANAVNLALDAIHRFGSMPPDYYVDWISVALEEFSHFELLSERLADHGLKYGDCTCHDGLWEIAVKTADDVGARMALVPLVFEARGLDVTPGLIERFVRHGDERTAAVLRKVLVDEVGHVDVGRRWFFEVCSDRNLDPWEEFERLVREFSLMLVPPFNVDARVAAGFEPQDLQRWTESFIKHRERGQTSRSE